MAQIAFSCPACGSEVHPNSKSCPSCGTRPESGWTTGGEIIHPESDLGLPDPDFDYADFVSREFDSRGNPRSENARLPHRLPKLWFFTALTLLAAIAVLIALGLW